MKNGLKIFGSFEGLFLEARIGGKRVDRFCNRYGVKTGESIKDNEAFLIRDKNGWQNAADCRVYFAAPDWVVDGLRKLGYRIVERQIEMNKYEGGLREYKWKCCNLELYWRLVDYGYLNGRNSAIDYDYYLMREHIREMEVEELYPVITIESENPIEEAYLLVA